MKLYYKKILHYLFAILGIAAFLACLYSLYAHDEISATSTIAALISVSLVLLLSTAILNYRSYFHRLKRNAKSKKDGRYTPDMLKEYVGQRLMIWTLSSVFIGKLVEVEGEFVKIVTYEKSRKIHIINLNQTNYIKTHK